MSKDWKDAFILLRIPFSIFLMPIFWFALSQSTIANWGVVFVVFAIIHLILYPASNGYNSYFDKDESSIGGLESPPPVNPHLFTLVVIFDILSVGLALCISVPFAIMITIYMLVSKAYSHDKIRLKKYPYLSTFLTVVFQGAFTFVMVQKGLGISWEQIFEARNMAFAGVSSLFLLGSYPITQIYQHEEDAARGDRTLSLILGIWGTFALATLAMLAGGGLLGTLYLIKAQWLRLIIFLIATLPIVVYMIWWILRARKDIKAVNFKNTMRMNFVSSLGLSAAFLLMIWFF